MKKYYIVEHGQVVSQACVIGEFESMDDAKRAAFAEMKDGDTLCDAIQEDSYEGFWCEADDCEKATLCSTNGGGFPDTMDDLWWWDDDPDTFYERDGSETEREFAW